MPTSTYRTQRAENIKRLNKEPNIPYLPPSTLSNALEEAGDHWYMVAKSQNLSARKYFSPSNLLTLYKAQIRPSLEYCSHIWGAAAPTTLFILDAVQRRAIRVIGDPALTCHLQPLSHRRAVGDLSLFYRYSNGFCSSELTAIIPPLSQAS
nr:unnamed protein product [Callosobruchus chinensis]